MSVDGQPSPRGRAMLALGNAATPQTDRSPLNPRAADGTVELLQRKDKELAFMQDALMKQVCCTHARVATVKSLFICIATVTGISSTLVLPFKWSVLHVARWNTRHSASTTI